jgi:WD40 repeat protein
MMRGRRGIGRRGASVVVLGLSVVASVLTVGTARASFPGTNGNIAYVGNGDVFVVDPSNPVPTQVTNTGGFGSVAFNAGATKLAAHNGAGLVLLDPVAGSAVTVIPNTTGGDGLPSFNPDGTKLAFNAGAVIATIDVAGTNRTSIFTSPNAGGNALQPEWSADGTFIAFALDVAQATNRIQRIDPSGGGVITLATTGPAGANACSPVANCFTPTVSPDSKKVVFAQVNSASAGLAQVNADGTTATPARMTTGSTDTVPSYSPDATQLAFTRGGALNRAPTDGSGTVTAVGAISNVFDTSWGVAPGSGTGTGTGTGGSVISVTAARTGADCVFSIVANPPAAGITVDFSITSPKGVVKLTRNDVSVPASPSVKAKKRGKNKVRNIALSDAKGATIGTSTATCPK